MKSRCRCGPYRVAVAEKRSRAPGELEVAAKGAAKSPGDGGRVAAAAEATLEAFAGAARLAASVAVEATLQRQRGAVVVGSTLGEAE